MNVASLLRITAGKFPEQTAVQTQGRRLSYLELESRTDQLASALQQTGLNKGDRVALLFYNSLPFVQVYFAGLKLGLAVTPVNFRLTGREIVQILNDCRPAVLFFGPEFASGLDPVRERFESVRQLIASGPDHPKWATSFEDFVNSGSPSPQAADVQEEDICQIMYTSGTTGRPKGAVLSHGNILWNLHNTILGREDRPGERALIAGPLYHTAALNNHLTIQIALGGTSILLPSFHPETYLSCIEEEQITVVSGAPALFNILLQSPAAGKYDTSSVQKCTTGADKLSRDLKRRLLEFFPNIDGVYDVYGCTEASPCIAILSAEESNGKHGSVGKALPFLEARIKGPDGRDLPLGEVGELVCRGPNVMQGYYGDPGATSEILVDGWLYTGDLATMDPEGYLSIVDRKKDMIVSGGENIYPREIEEVLITHPEILDVAIVGRADQDWGERVTAFVVRTPESRSRQADFVTFCRDHLAGYKIPRAFSFVSEIPRNPSGKALKLLLKTQQPNPQHEQGGEPKNTDQALE